MIAPGRGTIRFSGARLRCVSLRAHVLPRWAVAGVLVPTVWLAAVLIAGPSATALHAQQPRHPVDVIPFETEGLPLTEAENKRDNPSNSVPLALGRFNQLFNLKHRVRLFVLDHRWSFSQLGRISLKVATAHGLVECGANGPMHLMNTTRTHQGAAPRSDPEHCHVQPLEMLGSQR